VVRVIYFQAIVKLIRLSNMRLVIRVWQQGKSLLIRDRPAYLGYLVKRVAIWPIASSLGPYLPLPDLEAVTRRLVMPL